MKRNIITACSPFGGLGVENDVTWGWELSIDFLLVPTSSTLTAHYDTGIEFG